jgi:chlorobactene glucosyltransferase
MRWRLADGTERVYCRMYHGLRECVQGFSKNLYAVFYHNPLLFTFVWLFVLMVYSAPVAVLLAAVCGYAIPPEGIVTALGAVALSILQWSIIAARFRFSWGLSVSWILGQPVCVFIAFRSMLRSLTRRTTWKDRAMRSSQRPRNR